MKRLTITTILAIVMVVLSTINLYASTAYMEFEVEEITDTAVSVINSNGETFWFSRPGFPIVVGQNVIIRSDLEYQGGTVWTWDPATTEFVGREEYSNPDIIPSFICGGILLFSLIFICVVFSLYTRNNENNLIKEAKNDRR